MCGLSIETETVPVVCLNVVILIPVVNIPDPVVNTDGILLREPTIVSRDVAILSKYGL
jgi:hypothetical protein